VKKPRGDIFHWTVEIEERRGGRGIGKKVCRVLGEKNNKKKITKPQKPKNNTLNFCIEQRPPFGSLPGAGKREGERWG